MKVFTFMEDNPIRNVEALIKEIAEGLNPKYLFFWGHQLLNDDQIGKQCLSQWWDEKFIVDGITYPSAEHYMMAQKAKLFGDKPTYQKILSVPHPSVAKRFGRTVVGFDETVWTQNRYDIVIRGNEAKFTQNEVLKKFLLNTHTRILVEASPVDKIWGVGLAENDQRIYHPEKWRGLNLLGFALMEVRYHIQRQSV